MPSPVDGPLHVLRPAQGFGQIQRDSREREHLVVAQRGRPGLLGLLDRGAPGGRGDDTAPLRAHDSAIDRPRSGVYEEGVALDRSRDHALAEAEARGDDRLRHVAGLRIAAEDNPGDRAVDQHLHDHRGDDLVAEQAPAPAVEEGALGVRRSQACQHRVLDSVPPHVQRSVKLSRKGIDGRVLAADRGAHGEAGSRCPARPRARPAWRGCPRGTTRP